MSFSYKEFPQDVTEAFSNLIKEYSLIVNVRGDYYVELSNKEVIFSFLFDKGEFFSHIQKQDDDFTFSFRQVYQHLFPDTQMQDDSKTYPQSNLRFRANLLANDLNLILLGDFHWYQMLKKEIEYERRLVSIVMGPQMDYQHPISQKFWKRDKSWKADMIEYIKEKGIQL